MEKFKQGQIVKRKDKEFYIMAGDTNYDQDPKVFRGMVISGGTEDYPDGEYSETWHRDKFEVTNRNVKLKY
jgi:hypothetical protein